MRPSKRLMPTLAWMIVVLPLTLCGQARNSRPKASQSCLGAAKRFYGWYVPVANRASDGPAFERALATKREVFDPKLYDALKGDADAQNRAAGEITGIDFDPFLQTQDPAQQYVVRNARVERDRCSVEIWREPKPEEHPSRAKPDAVADFVRAGTKWKMANVWSGDGKTDLLTVLAAER